MAPQCIDNDMKLGNGSTRKISDRDFDTNNFSCLQLGGASLENTYQLDLVCIQVLWWNLLVSLLAFVKQQQSDEVNISLLYLVDNFKSNFIYEAH